MGRQYFEVRYRLRGRWKWLLWYSDDVDGVETSSAGQLLVFRTVDSLRRYTTRHQLAVDDSVTKYDLDIVFEWLHTALPEEIQCEIFLNAWNLFGDVANSVTEQRAWWQSLNSAADAEYAKLVAGCNLPALRPTGPTYTPLWSDEEAATIAELFDCGIGYFWKAEAFED